MTWLGSAWLGWLGLTWLAWSSLARLGQAWLGLAKHGLTWLGPAWLGSAWLWLALVPISCRFSYIAKDIGTQVGHWPGLALLALAWLGLIDQKF